MISSSTFPPATTGTYAELSQPLRLNRYSKKAARSFSEVQSLPIASVNARPEAWPAFRMLVISASLLIFRTSFIELLRGLTATWLRSLDKPSALEIRLEKIRVKADVGAALKARSVWTSEASATIGESSFSTLLISPD